MILVLSHISLVPVLALNLNFNPILTTASLATETVASFQKTQPLLLASSRGEKDDRRRGECEPFAAIQSDIWSFNICEADTFCYATPQQIRLWLPQEKRSGLTDRLVITNTHSGKSMRLSWRASHSTITWPVQRMPISSGIAYLLKLRREQVYFSKEIVLYKIPDNIKHNIEQLRWMKQQGCSSQLEMLLQYLHQLLQN